MCVSVSTSMSVSVSVSESVSASVSASVSGSVSVSVSASVSQSAFCLYIHTNYIVIVLWTYIQGGTEAKDAFSLYVSF